MRVLPLAVLLLAAGSAGCETFGPHTCDPSAGANPTVTYNGGTVVNGVYMSSTPPDGGTAPDGGTPTAWNGELLNFQGGAHYQLLHHLGSTPTWWYAYLSFDRCGVDWSFSDSAARCEPADGGGGMLSTTAGNQVLVLGVDDKSITVANDSCVDYWLLVVAGLGAAPPPGP
jgi:hypothetical protein